MKFALLMLVALLLVTGETAFLRPFGLSLARADVHLVIVIVLALRGPTLQGAIGSFSVGYMVDALSGMPTGLPAFASVVGFLLIRVLTPFIDNPRLTVVALLAGLLSLVYNVILIGGTFLVSQDQDKVRLLLASLPICAVLTIVATCALWGPLARLERMFKKKETFLRG